MSSTLTVAGLTIGLGLTVAAGAQPAPPIYGQTPPSGQMMGQGQMMVQGQMMGGQNAMMNDPEMRRQMTEMSQVCGRMMGGMAEMDRMRPRNR